MKVEYILLEMPELETSYNQNTFNVNILAYDSSHIIFILCKFFTPALTCGFLHKSTSLLRIILSILPDLNDAVIWVSVWEFIVSCLNIKYGRVLYLKPNVKFNVY